MKLDATHKSHLCLKVQPTLQQTKWVADVKLLFV